MLLHGDALATIETLPANSVQSIVTSPPYWMLRDYGFAGQSGLEPTFTQYVDNLVVVFRAARRVLRRDGTLWLNLGDSYNAYSGNRGKSNGINNNNNNNNNVIPAIAGGHGLIAPTLKAKDLIGIPWRVALALQADGWYLRSEIIWAKPNGMPSPVSDRPTTSHEHVFLLSQAQRYYYDADAIREPVTASMVEQMAVGYEGEGQKPYEEHGVQNPSSVKARIIKGKRDRLEKQRGHGRQHAGFNDRWAARTKDEQMACGANARSVWRIAPEQSKLEHYAVMPRALARRCVLAGCPAGGVVMDPYAGMATTGVVALEEGRSFIGIEASPEYHPVARERLGGVAPLLASEGWPA
jgi:DNA modification methylase